ncbi:uncharacterized protein K02A2.6-like [Lucilia sericata]|uniref:uncharacterized protein K02A2.6-like n=1 Tax=Lucilia sericata TaxID=13632 RepID=UPI0018A800F3|nr:uncharacterized protein K02A2.6-like [Lucilia sericata]
MAQDSKILELLELQSKLLATLTQGNASSINQDLLMEKLSNSITEFCYDQANSSTFNNWYARFEDIFLVEGKDLDDAARVRLLMRKLNNIAYGQYSAYILPRNPRDVTFADTVKILKDMYGIQDSIFSIRYKCLQTVKMSHEDLISYGARVNKLCENFKLSEMNADEFKCLVFVCGLQSNADSDVRMRCLSALEDDPNQNINKLITSAQRLLNLKHDTAMVEVNTQSSINAIKSNPKSNDDFKGKAKPKTPCWNCGAMHYSKYCTYLKHVCTQCKNMGHKEGYCKNHQSENKFTHEKKKKYNKNHKYSKPKSNVVQINRISYESRRKFVTVNIIPSSSTTSANIDVKMQIDTASDVSIIGKTLWRKMGNPGTKLSNRYVTSASKDQIKLIAEFPCQVRLQGDVKHCNLLVVDIDTLSIFGSDWLEIFGLWDKPLSSVCSQIKDQEIDINVLHNIKSEYADIFQNSPSKCTKAQVHLQLKPNVKPIFRVKRPVAYAMLSLIEDELQRLETLGIITPVDNAEWAAPIVAVKKPNGKVRICGDYSSGLNDSLEPHMYPLHRPEDLYAKVGNS